MAAGIQARRVDFEVVYKNGNAPFAEDLGGYCSLVVGRTGITYAVANRIR